MHGKERETLQEGQIRYSKQSLFSKTVTPAENY
jgi:hypothetical protein